MWPLSSKILKVCMYAKHFWVSFERRVSNRKCTKPQQETCQTLDFQLAAKTLRNFQMSNKGRALSNCALKMKRNIFEREKIIESYDLIKP